MVLKETVTYELTGLTILCHWGDDPTVEVEIGPGEEYSIFLKSTGEGNM